MIRRLDHPLAAIALAFLIAGVTSCTSRPDDPQFENALDPAVGGDPFALSARFDGSAVFLQWSSPGELFTHEVYRSLDPVAGFVRVGTVDADAAPIKTYSDPDFEPYATNYYRIRVVDEQGNRTSADLGTAAVVAATLFLSQENGFRSTPSRTVSLLADSDVGDEIELAASDDFTASSVFAVPDSTLRVDWNLGPASANGDTLWVFGRAVDTGVPLDATTLALVTSFVPMVSIDGATRLGSMVDGVTDTTLVVRVDDDLGVTQLRFAGTRVDLDVAGWQLPDSTYTRGVTNQANPVPLLIEFESDFGYTYVDSVSLAPAELSSASFTVVEAVDSVVVTTELTLVPSAPGASYMAFSEDPEFSGVSWTSLASTASFTLSSGAGKKTIYGQFTNPWAPVPQVVAVEVTLFGSPGP